MRLIVLLPALFLFLIQIPQSLSQNIYQQIAESEKLYQEIESYNPFNVKEASRDIWDGDQLLLRSAHILKLEEGFTEGILERRQSRLKVEMPVSGNHTVTLLLKEVNVFAPDALIKTSSGLEIDPEMHSFRTYWGIVKGNSNSRVGFNVFEDRITGFISISNHDFTLGKMDGDEEEHHILYYNQNLNLPFTFSCGSTDENLYVGASENRHNHGAGRALNDCVNIYIETDYNIYQDKGSVNAVIDHVTGIFSQTFLLYDDESIDMAISELFVWDTPSPYSGSDAVDFLEQFTDELDGVFNGDLAHLVRQEPFLGGVAWVDVLCFPPLATGFSGISSTYQNVPLYSYSVFVVAHELGHNLGSRHTHACVWNNDNTQIDDCGNVYAADNGLTPEGDACFNQNNPIIPPNGGTIMSYCNLISGVNINFNNGMGPQPGDLMRNTVNSANCLGACADFNPPVANFTADQTFVCAPMEVQFSDLSENDPETWIWDFPGGNPSESQDQNPLVLYESAGTYDVSLEVTNTDGSDFILFPDYITVEENPEALFDFTVDGLSVLFNNNSQNTTSFFWDFGDDNFSTEAEPFHEYQESGSYFVSLTVFNDCGEEEATALVEVFEAPEADFTSDLNFGCVSLEVRFENTSSGSPEFFEWEFEGGNPENSNEENPLVTYNETGKFDVKLTATNPEGSSTVEIEDFIEVTDVPEAEFEVDSMESRLVVFKSTSLAADSLFWDFGDGKTSKDTMPAHEYERDGVYNVTLIAQNLCGRDTFSSELKVITPPQAGFTLLDSSGCVPHEVLFVNQSSANTDSVYWEFPGGTPSTSTADSVVVTWTEAGFFGANLYAFGAGGMDILQADSLIVTQSGPDAELDIEVVGDTVFFTKNLDRVDAWELDFGDGNITDEFNPVHQYTEMGNYQVVLRLFNECDTVEIETMVTIGEFPSAGFSIQGPAEGCVPFVVQFENLSSPHATDFQWHFEGVTPSTSNEEAPEVVYENPGTFSAVLIASNALGTDTAEVAEAVYVNDTPTAEFTISDIGEREFDFINQSFNATDFMWDFGDGNTSTVENPGHEYEEAGEFDVLLIASNECGADTFSAFILISQTLELGDNKVNVYPNPTSQWINMEFEHALSVDMEFTIFSISGKLISEGKIHAGSSTKRLNMGDLPAGGYLIDMGYPGQRQTLQIQVVGD
jgi:PKD repeat protein